MSVSEAGEGGDSREMPGEGFLLRGTADIRERAPMTPGEKAEGEAEGGGRGDTAGDGAV